MIGAPGGGYDERDKESNRGGVQRLLKRTDRATAHSTILAMVHSEPLTHTHLPPEATSRAKMVGIALLRPPKGSPEALWELVPG